VSLFRKQAPQRTQLCHLLAGQVQPFGDRHFPPLGFQADAAVRIGLLVDAFYGSSRVVFNVNDTTPAELGMEEPK